MQPNGRRRRVYIEKRSNGWHVIEHANKVAFIPNSFVRVNEGHSPLHRLVNNGELDPIMLAAELYELQNLMDYRGVPAEFIRGYFYSADEHRIGTHKLHHLVAGRSYQNPKTKETESFDRAYCHKWRTPGFWDCLRALDAAHVVEWAIYSANGKPPTSDEYGFNRPQRPLGVLRNGRHVITTPESRPAFMAYLLWCLKSVGTDYLSRPLPVLIDEWRNSSPVIALENTSVQHVEGISILRMVHRAATENTSVWYRDLCQDCEKAFFFAEAEARDAFPQVSNIAKEITGSAILSEAISM